MKIQLSAIDSTITALVSDAITDIPEMLGAFLPMLMALPTQPMPSQMEVSFTDELPLANESEQALVVDCAKGVDEKASSSASTELMAMLNAAKPAPIKPQYHESEEPLAAVESHQVNTSVAMALPVLKPDRQNILPESPLDSSLQPIITESPLSITNLLPVVKTANYQDNAISKEALPPEQPDNQLPIIPTPAKTLIKQSIVAIEPVTKALEAMDVITPVVMENASELNLCHTVLNTTVDFFNKQLAPIDNPAPLASSTIPSVNAHTKALINPEKIIALEALQYNASQLTSLKAGNYSARLRVYPPDAGQITADILIHKGTTDITLRSDNPSIRHFLEMHLQPLKESFQQSTLQLGHVAIQANASDSSPFHHSSSEQRSFVNYSPKSPEKNSSVISALGEEAKSVSSQSIIDTWV